MGKRGRILIAVAAAAFLSVVAWVMFHAPAPEPVYEGRTLTFWLDQLAARGDSEHQAAFAVSKIGTNAIPALLQMLRAHDSSPKSRLLRWLSQYRVAKIQYTNGGVINTRAWRGFRALGPQASNAVPGLIKILDQNLAPESEWITASTLGNIGPDAKAAVPALVRASASTNDTVRNNVIYALGQIHADPDAVIPVLTNALHDPSALNRAQAVWALGVYGKDARPAIPALVALYYDPSANSNSAGPIFPGMGMATVNVHSKIEVALRQIDPEAPRKLHTNTAPNSNR